MSEPISPLLTVVLPCFNEENGIAKTLDELFDVLERAGFAFEIIAVNDGSTDRTLEVLKSFEDRVHVINLKNNKGYGAALKRGFRVARAPYICITDADGSYPNDRIPELFGLIGSDDCEMVVGARTGKDAAIPLIRRPAKWVIGRLAEYVADEKIPDINSGLRIFSKAMAERMYDVLPDGFSLTTTITLGMMVNGFEVRYVPVDYYRRIGHSKIKPIRDTLNFVQLIAKMALYFQPLKVFIPLSLFLFLGAIGWGFGSLIFLGQVADVSVITLTIAAVQVGAVGLLAELIRWRIPTDHQRK